MDLVLWRGKTVWVVVGVVVGVGVVVVDGVVGVVAVVVVGTADSDLNTHHYEGTVWWVGGRK